MSTVYYLTSWNHHVIDFYAAILCKSLEECGYTIVNVSRKDFRSLDKRSMFLVLNASQHFLLRLYGFKNVIVWYRGIWPEESYMRNHSKLREKIANRIEKYSLLKSKASIFVSNYQLQRFCEKYSIDKNMMLSKSYVMPCYNCDLVPEAFNSCEKYDKNIFCYVGSMAPWQYFRETALFFKKIEQEYGDKVFFKVFTPQQDVAKNILSEVQVENCSVGYSKQEDLPQNLAECKYGFILREDNEVNNVATPTKLSTYLSNGLIPIISKSIKDYALFMTGKDCFVLIDNDLDVSPVRKYIEFYVDAKKVEKAFTDFYAQYYNTANHIKNLVLLFKRLL